ncbi:hypothetical protein [Candidatus Brachybacter algidus]|uniref:hypothetical protein n=1 Tax=Candidatus Brachybacter algidus TaxID=2982024 RepID=UPI001D4CB41A|nr:hypothetical protein [Candidatus Brachybacter algidus]MBK6449988.1 hypothetical protein [Candidatus Brachybacter algidus]
MENNHFSKLNKENFKVPEGYFEGLEDKVLARLESNMIDPKVINIGQHTGGRKLWRRIVIGVTSVAACAAFFVFYNRGEVDQEFNLSNLKDTEIINYLNENADEIELDLLVDGSQYNGNVLDLIDTDSNINQDDLLDEINIEELF